MGDDAVVIRDLVAPGDASILLVEFLKRKPIGKLLNGYLCAEVFDD